MDDRADHEAAGTRVRAAWAHLGGADDVGEHLVACHREPHRHYHTVLHVAAVLGHVERLVAEHEAAGPVTATVTGIITGIDVDAVVAAALFHDVVYDPRSTTNEARSADEAAAACRTLGWSDERVELVRSLVLATAGHEPDSGPAASAAAVAARAVLLDADLAVLGSDPADYATYVRQVRHEFAHVDDATWRLGRARVLRSFLDRPAIYATARVVGEREARARANLLAELSSLAEG
jgi:predicted metal-dependent HD superfamily phosphohydrolase